LASGPESDQAESQPTTAGARVRSLAHLLVLPPLAEGEHRRLVSIDVLRGLALAGMLLVNNRAPVGEPPLWLSHVDWEGLRFADVVFPAFLFVAGVSLAFSFGRRAGQHPAWVWAHFVVRVAALVAIGLALNHFTYGEPLRMPGVLQRIGLALLIAAPFARLKPGWIVAAAAVLLAAHGVALARIVPPGDIDPALRAFEALPRLIDTAVFGAEHLHPSGFDPEGLLGLVSSAGQVLLGAAVGRTLHEHPRSARALVWLALAGCAAFIAGWGLDPWLPVVKKLWTPSFVLVTSGAATVALVALYALADWLKGERLVVWVAPLGRNALAAYVGAAALTLWLRGIEVASPSGKSITAISALAAGFVSAFGPAAGALAYSAAHVVVIYAAASALDRARLYIKL
jgi:predicted acyltransferase